MTAHDIRNLWNVGILATYLRLYHEMCSGVEDQASAVLRVLGYEDPP
jgi:hypothetical protein